MSKLLHCQPSGCWGCMHMSMEHGHKGREMSWVVSSSFCLLYLRSRVWPLWKANLPESSWWQTVHAAHPHNLFRWAEAKQYFLQWILDFVQNVKYVADGWASCADFKCGIQWEVSGWYKPLCYFVLYYTSLQDCRPGCLCVYVNTVCSWGWGSISSRGAGRSDRP